MNRSGCVLSLAGLIPLFSVYAADRPNILFIFSDDHAAQSISAYGCTIRPTPQLDRIASEGAIFQNNYCNNALCVPSRAAVLTGKHSHKNEVYTNWMGLEPRQHATFPVLLNQAGYQTAIFGKWHLKFDPAGFDAWQVFPDQGDYYNPVYKTPEGNISRTGYCTDITTTTALQWLKSRPSPDQPFLLCVQYKAPHQEYMPGPTELKMAAYKTNDFPEPETLFDDYSTRSSALGEADNFFISNWHDLSYVQDASATEAAKKNLKRMTPEQLAVWNQYFEPLNTAEKGLSGLEKVRAIYQRYVKNYYMAVDGIDRNLGRLLDYLDTSGLSDNTIVIYSSDQGYFLGEHGQRGKRWFYEETGRMPLMIRWPGQITPGTSVNAITQNIDYAPTLLDIAGLEIPAEMQGRSFLPLLSQPDAPWRDAIYYNYYQPNQGVAPHEGVRTDRCKLIYFYQKDEWELYDLQNDPLEVNNLAANPEAAGMLKTMQSELTRLRQELEAPSYEDLRGETINFKTPLDVIKAYNASRKQ